jgi:hypothetical protein
MAPRPYHLLLGSMLVAGPLAGAAEPQDFVPPPSLSPQEVERLKEASKSNLGQYGKDVSVETEPFPWMAVLLGALTIAGGTPFAWRAYRRMTQELNESGPAAPRKRPESTDESP